MTRRSTARLRDQRGIMMIEIVTAMVVFAVLAAAFSLLMASSFTAQDGSRERTLGQQIANEQIESIRRLPYDNVGTVGGNPPGTVVASRSVDIVGVKATVATAIAYVNDPGPLSYSSTANYKRVTVTVTRTSDGTVLARQQTLVTPKTRSSLGGVNAAVINVLVVDQATNAPVPGVTVSLSGGPSSGRSDVSDAAGVVAFPSLTANPVSGPTSHYDVTLSPPSGYYVFADDVPPAAAAHVSLAPGQTFSTVLRVYRPAGLRISLTNYDPGQTTYVSVGSSAGAERFLYTGGTLTVTTINGQPLSPGQFTIGAHGIEVDNSGQGNGNGEGDETQFSAPSVVNLPGANPTLPTDVSLTLAPKITHKEVIVAVTRPDGITLVPGARVDITGGPNPGIYSTAVTSSGVDPGKVTMKVPSGSGFTITAWGPAGQTVTPWTGSITSSPMTVQVIVP